MRRRLLATPDALGVEKELRVTSAGQAVAHLLGAGPEVVDYFFRVLRGATLRVRRSVKHDDVDKGL